MMSEREKKERMGASELSLPTLGEVLTKAMWRLQERLTRIEKRLDRIEGKESTHTTMTAIGK